MKEKVITLLKEGKSISDVMRILNISEHQWRKLKLIKLPKYNNIFDELSEKSIYWLGFLWADGSLTKNTLELELNINDLSHLNNLQELLTYIKVPTIYIRSRNNTTTCRISISDNNIAKSLKSLGFDKKGIRSIPNIPNNLIIHFIRGYFDGDGCLFYNKNEFRLDISGPEKVITFIKNYISDFSKLEIINNKSWVSNRIYWYGKENVKRILLKISKDSTIKLERKYTVLLH